MVRLCRGGRVGAKVAGGVDGHVFVYRRVQHKMRVIRCRSAKRTFMSREENALEHVGCARHSREDAGEFSNEDVSEDWTLLALEGRRAWKVRSGMESGVRRSESDDASDMLTSMSTSSALGNTMRFGFFASCSADTIMSLRAQSARAERGDAPSTRPHRQTRYQTSSSWT